DDVVEMVEVRCGAAVGMVMIALAVGGDEVMVVFGIGRGVVVTCRWRWWQWGWDGGDGWRVMESGVVDLIDRETGSIFGVRRKSFLATAAVGGGGQRLAGGGRLWWLEIIEREREPSVCVCLFCYK
nr:hypothetical protein [Tanacetum cinerariifolium]